MVTTFKFWFLSFLQSTLATVNIQLLPDKGERLLKQVQDLEAALSALNISTADPSEKGRVFLKNLFFFFVGSRSLQNSLLKIVFNMEEIQHKRIYEWNNSNISCVMWWLPKGVSSYH